MLQCSSALLSANEGVKRGSVQGACYTRDVSAKEQRGLIGRLQSIHSPVHLSAFRSMRTFLKALKRQAEPNEYGLRPIS